jgi:acyl-CoA synthetase (AMP-forming)/AMP-acid ligase II
MILIMDAFLDLEKSEKVAPASPAILAPGRPPLSYSALLRSIAELRVQFAGAGLVNGHRVALALPDGPDFLVTLLAATAFGPCAPLDPSASRQEYQGYFSQLRASSLITTGSAISAAKAQGMRVIELGDHLRVQRCYPECGPTEPPATTSACLLMFTSSTTGIPKLVPIAPANLEASCRDEARVLDLTGQDRLLNLTPQFNLRGLRTALSQLCLGGSVVCPPRFDPDSFPQWLEEFEPTWISVAAPGLNALCSLSRQIPGLWRGTGVRFIRSGGTAPDPHILRELEQLSGVPVLDGYGTTETGGATRETVGWRKPGSVGRTTGAEIAIFDDAGSPVGPLAPGEIAIRGANVTSGYLENDDANRRAFHAGWFRTRDQGYLDEDGFLFLTGRIDDVINRGGQKVQPQDVEAVLKDHPAVEDAAVFGVAHKTLGEEVAALVVLNAVLNSGPVAEIELRRFAETRLTSYKVPHSIQFVDQIPRTGAGKLQRRLLRDTYGQFTNLEQAPEAPATETEKALAAIWESELRQGPISREANFFSLGGDSLTAALVGTQIQSTFGVNLDLRAFVEYPRLRDLSRVLDELRLGDKQELEALEYAPRDRPLPQSFAQQRTWKYSMPADSEGISSANYNVAFAHLLRGPLDRDVLRRSMIHLIARHEILRTTCHRSGGRLVQEVHSTADCELRFTDLSHLPQPEQQARSILQAEARKPFDLARGPLVRFVLAYLGRDQHWLIRINHHIISDAHSWKLYFSDLGSVYSRTPQPICSPRVDYGDYALWQHREWSPSQPACRSEIEWWADRFSRLPPASAPLFRESGKSPSAASEGLLTWGVDPATSSRLARLKQAEGVTCFALRLAAFTALLSEVTGQPDVIVGTHFSYRNRLEWQRTMGNFTNLVTLSLRADPAMSFRESARIAHRNAREAYAHGEVPYELLREELQSRGVTPPRIGVMFDWAEQTSPMRLGAVEMTWLERAAPTMPWGFSMFMDKHNEERSCSVLFDASLYDPEAVRSFVARFKRLLDRAARSPDDPICQLLSS